MASIKAFWEWDEKALPGSTYVYWTEGQKGMRTATFCYALGLYETGDTLLSQRRRPDGLFEYRATRMSPRTQRVLKRETRNARI